ncbi:MAG: DUF4136 domain-containing protein [Pseudomonadota bacterium]
MKALVFLRTAALGAAVVMLAGCAVGPKVDILQAPDADFSRYGTFSYVDPLGTDRSGYSSLISQQLVFSTRREMELRNFEFVEDPEAADLLLNFNAYLNERIRTREVVEPMIGPRFLDYRFGVYRTWPSYEVSTEVDQWTEGTLIIDLIDGETDSMIWEGVVQGKVTDRSRREAASGLDEAVEAIFDRFPIPASSQ